MKGCDSMNIETMTSKQLATEILKRKIANKENELFIKKGLEELRTRKVNDIVCKNGMIYSVSESQKKQVNQAKVNEFLEQFGKTIKEFEDTIMVAEHYCIKPLKVK